MSDYRLRSLLAPIRHQLSSRGRRGAVLCGRAGRVHRRPQQKVGDGCGLAATLIVAASCAGAGFAAEREWLIENVNLIPMTSESVLPDRTVVVRGETIARISTPIPDPLPA